MSIFKIMIIPVIAVLLICSYIVNSVKEYVPEEWVLTRNQLINKYELIYEQDGRLARRIMKAESEMYPGAENHNRRADGSIWSTDYCLWQINDYFHDDLAEQKGWDYKNNEEDCIEMGFYILKRDGTSPWNASKHKWNNG